MNYALFIHDHKFKKINNKIYSSGGLSNEILTRYVNYYGKIKVIARVEKCNTYENKFSEITNKNVEIINYKLLKKKDLINLINNSKIVILRIPSFIGSKMDKLIPKNKKCIVEVVACAWDALWNHSLSGKVIAPLMYYREKQIIKKAKYVIYVSNKFLQKRYPTNGYNIGCSDVSLSTFDDKILNKRLEKIKKMNDKKIVFGTLAAIDVKYKGQAYVIKAINKLKKEGIENIEYQLVGGGSKNKLEKLAKKLNVEDKIVFVGTLPHDKVFDWLDMIDIYIQPSNQEGLPRALVEAMSRACPCIGSSTGGIPELLDEEVIFKRKKVKKLIDKINLMLNDKELLKTMAKYNFEKSKNYSKDKLDKIRNDFYMKFAKKEKKA